MPLQATSGAASYDAFGGGVAAVPNYIEDVFSTWLYTGTGSAQTITNGIDVSTKGGLVWIKCRNVSGESHVLVDSARGATRALRSNGTDAEVNDAGRVSAFTTSGFTIGTDGELNGTGNTHASWTFREQPKFFDVVTYTGNGSTQNIAHNLGSAPGCIIVKRTDGIASWRVYHRSLGATKSLLLDATNAEITSSTIWNDTEPTSTVFTVSTSNNVNASGGTYVAYLFAHNAGGFGLTGTDNVISCGSFTTNGSGAASVTLGYEPQWVLIKQTDGVDSWYLNDNMRGMAVSGNQPNLSPNSSAAESAGGYNTYPNATGFTASVGIASKNYIYIAIRRGPMRVPTTGTSVFMPLATPATTEGNVGFPADLAIAKYPIGSQFWLWGDRLRNAILYSDQTSAENAHFGGAGPRPFDTQNGVKLTGISATDYDFWMMRRAPGFFDVVCYTGTGSARTVAHNLGVAPELMIVKSRSAAGYWPVYSAAIGSDYILQLNEAGGRDGPGAPQWNSTTPTASVFSLGASSGANANGTTFVAYLFASCPGVSKVGSYTGNGSSQTISCGFSAGARFVMVKRTDATGNWMVVDTARGLVSAGDPTLYLNSTAAEVTGNDWIDPDSSGFIVNQESVMNANVNGGTYIFLAIA